MHIFRKQLAIPVSDRKPHHSSFLAWVKTAVAPGFGPTSPVVHRPEGRLLGRSSSASPWPEPSLAARFRRIRRTVYLIAILMLSFVTFSFVASAGRSTSNGSATASSAWTSYIAEASRRFGVPTQWIRAVMRMESNGDETANSPKGAMGLMQVMPETYAELRLRYHLGADPYQPGNNILAGAAYLREMRDRFGPGGFLAAYNAGPGRYDDYLKRGRYLPEETRNYVAVLAPMIGVPSIPRRTESASIPSRLTTSGAAPDYGKQSRAPNKSRFPSRISQFDNRQSVQTMTLFARFRVAYEPALASANTIDITALEPPPARALNATSTAAETLRIRTSNAPRLSLSPSGDSLFAGRSAHAGK